MLDYEHISKDKLAKGFSYALKTRQMENVLNDNNIDIYTQLSYCFNKGAEHMPILRIWYWVPSNKISYERLYVRAYAVQNKQVAHAREKLLEDVFPEFIAWIEPILASPEDSTLRINDSCFTAFYEDGSIAISII